ncbi:hypothetical protein D3C87_1649310 [compost metagenome]
MAYPFDAGIHIGKRVRFHLHPMLARLYDGGNRIEQAEQLDWRAPGAQCSLIETHRGEGRASLVFLKFVVVNLFLDGDALIGVVGIIQEVEMLTAHQAERVDEAS